MRKLNPALVIGLLGALGFWAFSRSQRGEEIIADVIDYGADAVNYGADTWSLADRNVRAFLTLIGWSEGTERQPDPYRVVYGYKHTIRNLDDHPAVTGEWRGERLSDAMCIAAGLPPGCVSTAAGRYQIIRPTWLTAKQALGLPDFSPDSQDRAALYLIEKRGALDDVKEGRVTDAVAKVRREWASLPGSGWGQPERALSSLIAAYTTAGGTLA